MKRKTIILSVLLLFLLLFFSRDGFLKELCSDFYMESYAETNGSEKRAKGSGMEDVVTRMPESTENPDKDQVTEKPSQTPAVKEKAGWHGKGKKRYYLKKNGKRAKGYQKIDGKYYYLKTSGYVLQNAWKSVGISGKKYLLYFGKNGSREMDVSERLDKESKVSYLLETNLTTNSVMVYARWKTKGYVIPVKRMRCSVGMSGHRTIRGTYCLHRTGSRWHVLRYGCYGQYCTRIRGPFLFHSVVYQRMGDRYSLDIKEYKKLGKSASHGCVRLQVEDARWIYNHAGSCTAHLYEGKKEKLPIPYPERQTAGKTKNGHYYDPTDK